MFTAAALYPILLTPRFSEVHDPASTRTALAVYSSTHTKPLKRLEFLSTLNSQLEQGVNERVSRLNTSVAIGAAKDEGRNVE